jgi:hypothetical protein
MTTPRVRSLLLIGLLLWTAAPGRPDAPSEPQALSVSPADLRSAGRAGESLPWFGTAREFYYENVDFDNRYDRDNYAPLFLPHGARIRSLAVRYMDRGCAQAQDIRVALLRQNMASGLVQTLAEVGSQGLLIDPARKTLLDDAIQNGVVNNNLFSYSLQVRFNYIKRDRVRFHGATILYE